MTSLARRALGFVAAVAMVALVPWGPAYAADQPVEPVRVMFMGDSITGSPGCWRAQAWVDLTDAGHAVDMVGTRTDDECGGVVNAAGDLWDPDNSGYANETTPEMYVRIARDGLLERTQPDVIAMLLGTNDFWGGQTADYVLDQYGALLDLMREHHPGTTLVVGTVLPMSAEVCPGCQEQIDLLNTALPGWVQTVTEDWSPVMLADLHTGFDVDADTYDGVHPNETGDAVIAAGWRDQLAVAVASAPTLPTAPSPDPSPDPSPTPSSGTPLSSAPTATPGATDQGDSAAAGAEGPATAGIGVWGWLLLAIAIAGGIALTTWASYRRGRR